MIKKIKYLFLIITLGLCGACTKAQDSNKTYTVEFKNQDNSILYQIDVKHGNSAQYNGSKPIKEAPEGSRYFYDFSGWDKKLNNVKKNLVVYPKFHMIDKTEINDGDYTYRRLYKVEDDKLVTIGYEIYKYNNLENQGVVRVDKTYKGLPILRVGEACFMECLTEKVVLPDTIEVIDSYAFNSTDYLMSVNIPDSTYVLGHAAFYLTNGIQNINLNNIGFIDSDNFHLCGSLKSIEVSKSNHQYSSYENCLYSKDYKTFIKAPETLTKVNFHKTTQQFEKEALSRMKDIESITIPSSILNLNEYLFFESKVKQIIIEASIESIPNNTFEKCINLTDIELPNTVKEIKNKAFYRCESLKEFKLSDNVESIGDFSFAYCFDLESFYIPQSLKEIGYGALDEQESLLKFEIADNQNYFSVYQDCLYSKDYKTLIRVPQNKQEIVFAENVEIIGSGAFYNCKKIEQIILPNTLKVIESFAFYFVNQVYELYVPDSVHIIEEAAFQAMEHLVEIHLPTNLESIAANLFTNCSILQNINIPMNLKTIGSYAFSECLTLSSLTLPATLISIGKDCFISCNSLDTINYMGSESEWKKINGIAYCGLTDQTTINYDFII